MRLKILLTLFKFLVDYLVVLSNPFLTNNAAVCLQVLTKVALFRTQINSKMK